MTSIYQSVCTVWKHTANAVYIKWNFTQKGKFCFSSAPPSPPLVLQLLTLYFLGGEQVPSFDRYLLRLSTGSPRQWMSEGSTHPLFACNLLEHVTVPRSLQDHSKSAVRHARAQWEVGCQVGRSHSWLPTLNMPVSGTKDQWRTCPGEDRAGSYY